VPRFIPFVLVCPPSSRGRADGDAARVSLPALRRRACHRHWSSSPIGHSRRWTLASRQPSGRDGVFFPATAKVAGGRRKAPMTVRTRAPDHINQELERLPDRAGGRPGNGRTPAFASPGSSSTGSNEPPSARPICSPAPRNTLREGIEEGRRPPRPRTVRSAFRAPLRLPG